MNKLRIALVTPEYITEKYFDGGLANYLHRLAKALVSFGHEVHVITLSKIDCTTFINDEIQIHRVTTGKLQYRLNRLSGNRLPNVSRWLDASVAFYSKLKQLNQQQAFDIVQFPNYTCCGLISSLFLSIPYVVRISSYDPVWNNLAGLDRNIDAKVREWLELQQLRLSRYTYAPSYTLQRILLAQAKIDNVRVIRTPFYLESKDWDFSVKDKYVKDKQYLLFFGRFQLHKGFHILARALPQFLAKYPDAYAVFVGKDFATTIATSMKDHAISFCSENDRDRLIFIDRLTHDKLYPIIADSKMVVLPSLIDNLPNACLEAMALGKPVIGTIGASFDEIITDNETGFLVPTEDVDALASKINQVWEHPNLQEIGQAAQQKLQEFLPEYSVKELLAYYREIMQIKTKYKIKKNSLRFKLITASKR